MIKAYSNAKRLLILKGSKSWSEKTFLTVNNMGSHFTGKGKQKDLFLLGYYDSDNKGHFL